MIGRAAFFFARRIENLLQTGSFSGPISQN